MSRQRLRLRSVSPGDALAVAGLLVVAYRQQAHVFRSGQYLDLGGPGDWIAHAYRSLLSATNGFTSWDRAWDRGYPNTDGWQQAPDWLTGVVSQITGASVPRTMVELTFLLLLAYPLAGYVALRLMRCGPLVALLGAALLLDNPVLYAFVDDYSGLFGLAALPVAVWVILDLFGHRGGWLGALFVGLLIELHPFAAVAAGSLILARLVYDRGRDWRRVLGQSAVAVAVAAPYWLPFLTNARPRAAANGVEASLVFADSHFFFRVGLAELSAGAVLLLGPALVALVLRRLPHARQTVCCLGAAAVMGGGLVLSYRGWVPGFVMEAQLTRSMPFVAVLLAMGLAPLGDLVPLVLGRIRTLGAPAVSLASAAVVAAIALVLANDGGYWTSQNLAPVTDDAYPFGHDIATYLNAHPEIPRPAVFWAPYDAVAAASFDAFGQVEFTGDYTARSWSVANTQLNIILQAPQLQPFAAAEPYLQGEGAAYLYAPDGRPEATTLDAWLARGDVVLVDKGIAGRIARIPHPAPQAFAAPATAVRAATLPDLPYYTDTTGAYPRLAPDFSRWAAVTTSGAARAATVSVSSPAVRSLSVDGRRGDILVVGQRWDSSWEATGNGQTLQTERVGADLLGVDLESDGTQVITVQHHPSRSQEAALLLLVLAVLAAAGLTVRDPGAGWRRDAATSAP
jgi:MFS family permease